MTTPNERYVSDEDEAARYRAVHEVRAQRRVKAYTGNIDQGYKNVPGPPVIEAAVQLRVSPIIDRFGTWAVTDYGVECLTTTYYIGIDGLDDPVLEEKVTSKPWVVPGDFCMALRVARELFRSDDFDVSPMSASTHASLDSPENQLGDIATDIGSLFDRLNENEQSLMTLLCVKDKETGKSLTYRKIARLLDPPVSHTQVGRMKKRLEDKHPELILFLFERRASNAKGVPPAGRARGKEILSKQHESMDYSS